MSEVIADTHAVIWFLADSPRLSANARGAFDASLQAGTAVIVSAVTPVEIVYLIEKGRLPEEAWQSFVAASQGTEASFAVVPFDSAMAALLRTISRAAVPDMPDRMIAATARYLDLPLITADHRIRSAEVPTIW